MVVESLRRCMQKREYKHLRKVVHRSESCKAIFHKADRLARATGDTALRCIHMLAAILDDPGEYLPIALKDQNADLDAFRQKVSRALHRKNEMQSARMQTPEMQEQVNTKSTSVDSSAPTQAPCHFVRLKGEQQAETWLLPEDRPVLIGRSAGGKTEPELSKEVRSAFARASEVGRNLRQPVGTVHILVGLLTIEDGITREIMRKIEVTPNQALERLTAALSNLESPGEERLALTRHHDMVLSIARSLAQRAGLYIVLERFVLEALLLTPAQL